MSSGLHSSRVSTLHAPWGQLAELLRAGTAAQLSQVAFGDAAQQLCLGGRREDRWPGVCLQTA